MSDLYFQDMTNTLQQAGISHPTLVIDKQRLDRNIDHLLEAINRGFSYRIVAKSLPSIPLLQYIMRRTGSNRLMSFHVPFLIHVVEHIPQADILMGKPMPMAAVRHFYQWLGQNQSTFKAANQLQWLVDSKERLLEYRDFAEQQGLQLRINLEINVGLNRGGFSDHDEFAQSLKLIHASPNLTLSGMMGYEAHVTKIPAIAGGHKKAFRLAMKRYQEFTDLIRNTLGDDALKRLCLNAGGSSTYPLYQQPGLVNEIATASALVKPTDFDVFTLDHHQPACYIAAPVLKDISNPEIPMASGLSSLLRRIGNLPKRGLFIYGGNWLASPCYPKGSVRSNILGHSSNQELYEVAAEHSIRREDFMFFRPTQSEAVFLQFGDIAVMDQGEINEYWPVFNYPQVNYPEKISNDAKPTASTVSIKQQ